MAELTKAMPQRGDYEFNRVLNKIRERNIDDDVERTLKLSRTYCEYICW